MLTDLPAELLAEIAQILVAEKAYGSCASFNRTCRATFEATCPVLWGVIDFRFTFAGIHPGGVRAETCRGNCKDVSIEVNRRLRDSIYQCQRYTKYIFLPFSPVHCQDNSTSAEDTDRAWEDGKHRLEFAQMIKLQAVVVADEGSGDDRFEIYLGPAFQYGTNDVRDLIVTCDPDQEIDMRDLQRGGQDRVSLPELGYTWAMYLTAGVPVADGSGNLPTIEDLFFDTFNLIGRIDTRKQFRELSCYGRSRLNVEVESIEQLGAWIGMFTNAVRSQPAYAGIAVCIGCLELESPEELASILQASVSAIWHGQNSAYLADALSNYPYGTLFIKCGKNRNLQGTLRRMDPHDPEIDWERDWDEAPASSPMRLVVSDDSQVYVNQKYAPNLLREPAAELEAV